MKHSYALVRRGRPILCLTPLLDPQVVAHADEEAEHTLRTSTMLSRQQADEVTFNLYNFIDFSVDRWIQDRFYVPRLLLSALVFTVSYFIFSLAVRDPIPMIDELIISTVLAIITWRSVAKRDRRSSLAQHRRQRLKVQASERRSEIVDELFGIEEFLDELAGRDYYTLSYSLCGVGEGKAVNFTHSVEQEMIDEMSELLPLVLRTSYKEVLRYRDQINALKGGSIKKRERLGNRLYQAAQKGEVDLPLLALALGLG